MACRIDFVVFIFAFLASFVRADLVATYGSSTYLLRKVDEYTRISRLVLNETGVFATPIVPKLGGDSAGPLFGKCQFDSSPRVVCVEHLQALNLEILTISLPDGNTNLYTYQYDVSLEPARKLHLYSFDH